MKSLYGYVFSFFLLLIMFGCADSVLDSWPGIGDLTIESGNKRFSDNSFGLKSDLILPGTTSDVSYSITSDCYRREQLSDEPDFEQRVYSKTPSTKQVVQTHQAYLQLITLMSLY